jgi:hypothetical protein
MFYFYPMHTLSALRRKRDEIASTIAAYEAKIVDARTDLAALDQAARLFDPEAESDEPSIRRELGWHRTSQQTSAAEYEVLEQERPVPLRHLAPPVARSRASDDEDAGPATSIGVPEVQFMEEVAYSATQEREQIPEEFFYLNWP